MAMIVLFIAAGASLMRGGRYVHDEQVTAATVAVATATEAAGTDVVADEAEAAAANAADAAADAAADEEARRAVRAGDGRATSDS
jgi:hypothetical protein